MMRPSVDGSVEVFNDAFHMCAGWNAIFIMHVSSVVSMENEDGRMVYHRMAKEEIDAGSFYYFPASQVNEPVGIMHDLQQVL